MQHKYLILSYSNEVRQDSEVHVVYKELRKLVGRLGPFNQVAHKGWDKKHITVWTGEGTRYHSKLVLNNQAGFEQVARQLATRDAELLDQIDKEKGELRDQLRKLEVRRRGALTRAWKQSLPIQLKDFKPKDV